MLVALLIALIFFIAMIVAVLLGSPDQRDIVKDCIDDILGTI
ncbi:hypothetical protein [Ornithinibacillus halophilus]|uniref:Uncharacterized protein n=1 Tax=Ornithinibacillus halophilus TaxID=930117 RepID=A0A1M5N1Q8_9BACI|nr:hypothetical protein [Ornithinibacillus halophilus]SHG82933.1 hypothetical protein SAMN05216225_106816 [Ornithinibacillus halophilus]